MDILMEKSGDETPVIDHSARLASDEATARTECEDTFVQPPSFRQLVAQCLALGLVVFLVWLDEGILATIIPSISNYFQSFSALAWYAPSYLFGLCAFQLPFGRVYKDFPTRPTFLVSLLIFEIGSIVQATAPNSAAFIVGRVITGIGGSGVLTGALTILSQDIPKSKLPFIMGCFSWIHGLCGITGPIIGGAIASSTLSWRWCFYLNPIISVASICPILYIWRQHLKDQARSEAEGPKVLDLLMGLDYLGMLTIVPSVVSLLLALQLGGSVFTWSDARAIVPIAVAAVLLVVFVLIQRWKGDSAMLPPRIAKLRAVIVSATYSATLDAGYLVMVYCLPIWFQAIKGVSALKSGYRILPLLAGNVIFNFLAATLAGKLGYYQPFMIFGSVLLTLGTGLATTLTPTSSAAKWVIYQILAGIGAGTGGQLPLIAVQDALPKDDVPIGYAIVLSSGYLGPTAALAITQAVFGSVLTSELKHVVPSVDPDSVKHAGVTVWAQVVPTQAFKQALEAYNSALTNSWFVAVTLAAISLVSLSGLKWKRLNQDHEKAHTGAEKSHDGEIDAQPETKNT